MTSDAQVVSQAQGVDHWLDELGLRFDPFRVLNASQDPLLHEYLVAHETFEAIRGNGVSFLFAPAGGGKSAFRVRLARACRVAEQGRRVFPIVYMLPEAVILAAEPDRWQAHLRTILQAAAFELLLRLAYRPYELLDLDPFARQMICFLLQRGLPGPLSHFLDQLETPHDLPRLAQPYDPTARWPKPPKPEDLQDFCAAMKQTPRLAEDAIPSDEFSAWLSLLTGPLGFEAVYLLLDGVDAYPETAHAELRTDAHQALATLSPLLKRADEWANKRLYLKAFLPLELEPALKITFPWLTEQANIGIMKWTSELLVSLLRRRVEAAAETAPASLDLLSHPGFRNVDKLVVRAVRPLPREVLVFVERMLHEHVRRAGPRGKLAREDFDDALRWYKETARQPTSPESWR
jgi:hypothetical protein